MEEESLTGGLANPGAVVRAGGHVLRPAGPYSTSIHAFLRAVRQAGFDGVPMPVGIDEDGRERLEFIEGDVPASPYPAWSQSDLALASIVELLRGLHDASRDFDADGLTWNDALADPAGGTIVCHNDIELSNVVFREGRAIAFIDFEFAAPGRPTYDHAQLARLCVPIESDFDQFRIGWHPADRPARLRLVADVYGLDQEGRKELLAAIDDAVDRIEVAARANAFGAGERATQMLAATGGIEKYKRKRIWWNRHYDDFVDAFR